MVLIGTIHQRNADFLHCEVLHTCHHSLPLSGSLSHGVGRIKQRANLVNFKGIVHLFLVESKLRQGNRQGPRW